MNRFLKNVLKAVFIKNQHAICQRVMVCREDKETVTKSKINVIIEYFLLVNLLLENGVINRSHDGSDGAIEWILASCKDDEADGNEGSRGSFGSAEYTWRPLEAGASHGRRRAGAQAKRKPFHIQMLVELAVYIILIPNLFKLQLLVENQALEKKLRNQCLEFLKNYKILLQES